MARRGSWKMVLARGAAVGSLALVVAGCNGTAWTMFGFDAVHSGDNAQETVIDASNVAGLVEAGSTKPVHGPVTSSPTTANGILYVTANVGREGAGTLYAYSATGTSNCSRRNPRSCRPLWSATPAGTHSLTASPAVDATAGIVYAASADGILYAYDASTGALEWQSPPLGGSVGSSPTIAGGYVYVPILYDWTYVFPSSTGYDGNNPSCETHGNGKRICRPGWGYDTPGDVFSSPAVAGGLFFSNTGTPTDMLYVYDAVADAHCSGAVYGAPLGATCDDPLWTAKTGGGKSSPAVAGGTVYVGSLTAGVFAFSAAGSQNCSGVPFTYLRGMTCTALWSAPTGRQDGSSPAVAGGAVYIGTQGGHLDAFDATDGTPLWSAATGGVIDSAPTVAGGVVYVGCSNLDESEGHTCGANLFGFDAASGGLLWTGTTGGTDGTVDESPIVVDGGGGGSTAGAVYVGSSSGPGACVGGSTCRGQIVAFAPG